MKRHHRWGEPDENEARACAHEGCTVRVRDAFREWQPAKGVQEGAMGARPHPRVLRQRWRRHGRALSIEPTGGKMAYWKACGMCLPCTTTGFFCSFPVKVDNETHMEELGHAHPWRSRYEGGCEACRKMERLGLWPEWDGDNAPLSL